MSGVTKSRIDLGRRPNNISAGEIPVVVCGVILYWNKNRDKRVARESHVDFFIFSLNV